MIQRGFLFAFVCVICTCSTIPLRAQGQITADFDGSGAVDYVDFSRLIAGFKQAADTTISNPELDLNKDGTVDGEDAFLFADVFADDAPSASLTTSTGPNTGVTLRLDPEGNGFLVYLDNITRLGGYRIVMTVPDTVSVSKVEDFLGIGMLPVQRTSAGVEIVGLVLGNKPIEQAGLIARVTFTGDTTGVGVSAVHLRGSRVSLGNHVYLGDRNTVASSDIVRIGHGDLELSPRVFDFGHLVLGETVTRTISLKNTFDAQKAPGTSRNLPFEIQTSGLELVTEPQIFGVLADTSTGLTTGAAQEITFVFSPMQTGVYSSFLEITTNRSEREKMRVHVLAHVVSGKTGLRRVGADFDSSGAVDYGDFDRLISGFGAAPDSVVFDIDNDGVIDADDVFLLADVLGGATGLASSDTVQVTDGANLGAAVRVQGEGEEMTLSVRDLARLGGYRIILNYNTDDVDVRWARDLSGGGILPIHRTSTGAEVVGMGFGALVESSGDFALAKISIRPLKGQADAQSLVSVAGVVFRGTRGERDSVGVVRIAANGLDASPRDIDFGNLRLGATVEKTFRIFNLNNTSTSFEIASSDSLVTTSPRSVGNLGAGRTWDVKVTYTSTDPGSFSSTLLVASIGDDPAPIAVQVKAFGTVVGVVPDSLAFGDIFIGQQQTKSIVITNPDLDPFVIDAIAFSGADTNYVLDPAVSTPLSVAGEGGSETLIVRFNPLVRGEILDTLRITGGDTTFVIPLSGYGREREASISVDSLDFDTVTLGRDSTLNVVLANTGNVVYRLDSLKIGQSDTSFSASGLVFPDTLLTGISDTLVVRYRPDTTGATADTLRVFGQDTTWVIPLSGTGLPRQIVEPPTLEDIVLVTFGGSITKSRNSIHFGQVRWGVSDTAKVRVRNDRSVNLTFRFSATDSQVTVRPDSVQNLPPNQEWDVVIAITPTDSIQTLSAFQITTDDIGDGITSIALISGGSNPVLSDSTVNFGTVGLGLPVTKSISVTNTGHSRLILENLSLSEDSTFVLVDPPPLPFSIDRDGDLHTFQVRFSPQVRGSFVDTLLFTASDTFFSVPISGTGREAKLVVAPDSITFGLLRIGVTDTMDVVLTNDGADSLTVDSVSLVGTATPFSLGSTITFPDTLLPNGDIRTIPIAFVPTTAASATDTLRVIAGLDTVWVPIAGIGTVASASVSVTAIDFGSPAMGRTVRDTVVVTNTGNVPFGLNRISLADGDKWFVLEGDLTDTLAVNQTLSIALVFRPDSTGSRKDTLQISGTDTSFAIPLSGIGDPSAAITRSGTGLTFTPQQLDYGDLEVGQTVRRIVRVVNAGTSPLTFSTTVDDPGISVSPSSLTGLPRDKSWDLVVDWTPSELSTLLTGFHLLADDSQVDIPVGRGGIFVELLTDSLAFGTLRLENDSTTVVRLRNPGQGTFVVEQLALDGERGFSIVNLPSLPVALSERDSLRISVKFDPTVSGDAVDTLRIAGSDTAFSVPLSGRGIQPVISVDLDMLDFGDLVSATDSTRSVIIRNTGNGPFVVDSLMLSGDPQFTFAKAPVSPSTLVANGGSDTVSVRFLPPDLGEYSGTLTFYGEQQTWDVALLGVSTATGANSAGLEVAFGPTITLNDSTLRFGDIPVGSTRKLSFTVKNNRDSSLAFTIASTDSQVSVEPKAFGGLLQAQSTDVVVSFTPVANGATSVQLNITSNASADGTISLIAEKNRPPASLSADAFDFGDVIVGTRDSVQVTITNPKILNFNVTALAFNGGATSPFLLISPPALPDTVGPNGGTRVLTIGFSPAQRGVAQDTLRITGVDTSFTITLSGAGIRALVVADVDELDFGTLMFGQDSLQTVTLSNTGDVPLVLTQITVLGEGFVDADSLVLPDTLNLGSDLTLRVGFAPFSVGELTGTLEIVFETNVIEVSLSGTGQAPPRTAPGPIALDLDPAPGDQGKRQDQVPGRQVVVDLAATEGALGISGFEVVLTFDPSAVVFDEFSPTDLFDGGTPIISQGEGSVQISVAFFGAVSAPRDSGSLGTVQFQLQGATATEIVLASGQFALSTGPVALELGSEGTQVTVEGSAEPTPDFDGDGEVGFTDFILFAGAFGTSAGEDGFDVIYDLDGDGSVGFGDFIAFASKFGQKIGKAITKPVVETKG